MSMTVMGRWCGTRRVRHGWDGWSSVELFVVTVFTVLCLVAKFVGCGQNGWDTVSVCQLPRSVDHSMCSPPLAIFLLRSRCPPCRCSLDSTTSLPDLVTRGPSISLPHHLNTNAPVHFSELVSLDALSPPFRSEGGLFTDPPSHRSVSLVSHQPPLSSQFASNHASITMAMLS